MFVFATLQSWFRSEAALVGLTATYSSAEETNGIENRQRVGRRTTDPLLSGDLLAEVNTM